MALFEVVPDAIEALPQKAFSELGISERGDLQRRLRQNVGVIAPDTLVLAEEVSEWDESRRRIDLLALDRDANLVVIELKRTEDGGHMELQAIRYAAMISSMTFGKAVELHARYLEANGSDGDAEAAILDFLEWDSPHESFAANARIVLVSAEFSKEIITTVLWLNDQGLDIRCVRLRPYALGPRVILDVQQIVPLPEAADFTVQMRRKADEARIARSFNPDFSKFRLIVDGSPVATGLTKRGLSHCIVSATIDKGVTPAQIAAVLPRSKWLDFEGYLSSEQFLSKALSTTGKLGGAFDVSRYFCDEDELFHVEGRTYVLSNQWSGDNIDRLQKLLDLAGGAITYEKE